MHRLVAAACLAISAAVIASPAPALAEAVAAGDQVVVTLESGVTFRGTVVSQDGRRLVLRSPGGTVRDLPLTSVRQVTREGGAPSPVPAAEPAAAAPNAAPTGVAAPAASGMAAPATRPAGPPAAAAGLRFGLGVSLPSSGDFPTFYVPIQLDPDLRLEPELAFASVRAGNADATLILLGLGVLFTKAVAPEVGAYGGVRAQLQRFSATGLDTETAWRVAAVAGGEWQPVSRVAVGVEAQLGYVNADGAGQLRSASGLVTAGLVFVRIFLND